MSQRIETTSSESGGYRTWAGSEPDGPDGHRWGYHVQVKDPEGTGLGAEIWLDGQQLHYVTEYTVSVGVNRADRVSVTFNAQSVNREPLP